MANAGQVGKIFAPDRDLDPDLSPARDERTPGALFASEPEDKSTTTAASRTVSYIPF